MNVGTWRRGILISPFTLSLSLSLSRIIFHQLVVLLLLVLLNKGKVELEVASWCFGTGVCPFLFYLLFLAFKSEHPIIGRTEMIH